ncbi:MAG: hypothetical protein EAY65_04840 [Alphaproteobacteria bacterium]|nr:MAG: hypothetical protein EAY65_04840 [Alphaproteobacteria bacterium]
MIPQDALILIPLALLSLCTIYAMVTDVQSYRIPNKVNGSILLLFIVTRSLFIIDLPVLDSLYAFAATFAIGYILFAFSIMGGGDVKMLSVLVLWIGWSMSLVEYLVVVAIVGGFFTIILLLARVLMPFMMIKMQWQDKPIPRLFTTGAPVPYGVAIGCVFLWMLWSGQFTMYKLV